MRRRISLPLLSLAAFLISCVAEPDPPKRWKDMTTSERVESLEVQLQSAKNFGERKMRGDVKRTIEKMLKQVESDPAPEFEPVIKQSAETLVEYRYPDTASLAYEYLGDYQKAIEFAEQDGDLERVQELMASMAEKGAPVADSKATDIRAQRGLEFLAQAEKKYKSESKSSYGAMQRKGPVKTREILAQAVEQLQGVSLSQEDFKRLLTLQLQTADGMSEAKSVASQASWTPPSGISPEEQSTRQVVFWRDLAAAERQPEMADIFLSKALAEHQNGKHKLSAEDEKRLLETSLQVAYSNANFAKALEVAQRAFPNDESKLALYKFAAASSSDTMRKNPYPFPPAEKSSEEHTYIYLFSPTSGGYVHQGFEELVESPPGKIDWSVPEEGDGVKAMFKGKEDFLYLVSLTGGFRRGFKPGIYDAKQVGVSSADPGIAFAGEGNFKFGQFVVHEVEWEPGKTKRVARCAVDFLGSGTGKLSDVCYGKIRYRSTFK